MRAMATSTVRRLWNACNRISNALSWNAVIHDIGHTARQGDLSS
jgi:hypothetical protein